MTDPRLKPDHNAAEKYAALWLDKVGSMPNLARCYMDERKKNADEPEPEGDE